MKTPNDKHKWDKYKWIQASLACLILAMLIFLAFAPVSRASANSQPADPFQTQNLSGDLS